MSVLKKLTKAPKGGAINQRFKKVEFEGEDGTVYECTVRTSLLNSEVEKLQGINQIEDRQAIWVQVAPYVTSWNIVIYDTEDGEYYEVAPPAEGGPESFKYAPRDLGYAIVGALMNEPFKKLDPKSEKPVEPTEKP